jgi:putative ABC transport system ATP-binding protein
MLLEIKDLHKTYKSGDIEFHALRGVNLDIDSREFTAIAGPSGSGKTTLLNCIGCIDRGEKGKILLNGEDLMARKQKELAFLRRDHFGFIFQTYNLIPVLTVYENIEMPLKLLGKQSDEEIKDMIFSILKRVDLDGLDQRKPLELSGGQQQRVSIARALVKKPEVILADEPTANLDSKTGESIINLMEELNSQDGVTFIFSTHDNLVMKHAKRLVEVRDGLIK